MLWGLKSEATGLTIQRVRGLNAGALGLGQPSLVYPVLGISAEQMFVLSPA